MYDQLLESTLFKHILSIYYIIYIFNNNSQGLYFFLAIINKSNEIFANHLKNTKRNNDSDNK